MKGAYLGPSFSEEEAEKTLIDLGAVFQKCTKQDMIRQVVLHLTNGKAVGWMQGRMEYGPRALGARSIIADPRSEKMQKQLNLKVKFRESFRPFAPSVLAEKSDEWFDLKPSSPYMMMVASVKSSKRTKNKSAESDLFGIDKLNLPRSSIPAVTHVDYSARVQTVHAETNPVYHELLKAFEGSTGCPVLVNTSFNVRGEPIVCDVADAFNCFLGTDLDILVIGNLVLEKQNQQQSLIVNYKDKYELD